jgi:hypothetical protein
MKMDWSFFPLHRVLGHGGVNDDVVSQGKSSASFNETIVVALENPSCQWSRRTSISHEGHLVVTSEMPLENGPAYGEPSG